VSGSILAFGFWIIGAEAHRRYQIEGAVLTVAAFVDSVEMRESKCWCILPIPACHPVSASVNGLKTLEIQLRRGCLQRS
jgi:hypothetical protein